VAPLLIAALAFVGAVCVPACNLHLFFIHCWTPHGKHLHLTMGCSRKEGMRKAETWELREKGSEVRETAEMVVGSVFILKRQPRKSRVLMI
jgi:hypothetical protein